MWTAAKGVEPQRVNTKKRSSTPKNDPILEEMRNDYKLVGLIGKGANGAVYKAKRRHDSKTVAVKHMKYNPQDFYKTK